ncbi:uncharacterized protein LOC141655331 [Silene latifolia]|uniref:uncharacterized protein LOC141655331 n=1 Tax=Silene latifolia TaxID=37657 RepID=UPI003D7737ED
MTSTEFDRFSSCTTAKEIWDGLELAYEGTAIVKKNRIDLLIQKYVSMDPNETLDSMSTRFLSIINELKNLGRTFPTEDIARKVLRSLTKKWRPKVTVMEECRDLTNLSYQELIGALMAHELTLNADETEPSTRKSMALASENNESDLEDETVLFAKRFRKNFFNFKQNKTFNNNKSSNKKSSDSKNSFANRGCFKCDTEDDEESEDEEVANLYLSNISLDIDNDSSSEFCLMGESDSDEDEDEVSYLELKKQVKKLSKSALVKYFEQSLDHCHEQSIELKEQIMDIAKENQLLKAKAKKLKSKATVDDTEALNSMANEKQALESKKLNELQKSEISAENGTISDHKKEIDFLNKQLNEKEINQANISKQYEEKIAILKNLHKDSSSTDIKIDHKKCNEEIQSLKELLLHARKVHDKWEGSTKVLNFLTEQSDNNMKMGLGHECYGRRDHSKCKATPSDRDFRKRKYANLPEYLICTYCGDKGHIKVNCVKHAHDIRKNVETHKACEVIVEDDYSTVDEPKDNEERNNEFQWFYDMSFDFQCKKNIPKQNTNETSKTQTNNVKKPRSYHRTPQKKRTVVVKENNQWYLDSGCSRHMTGDKNLFLSLKPFNGGKVTFGDNKKGKVVGIGKIGISPSHAISEVYLVEGLKHNLLSISQLCDKGNKVVFHSYGCRIIIEGTSNVILEGQRKRNVYMIDLNAIPTNSFTCMKVTLDDPCLWHKKFAHISSTILNKLKRWDLVEGLPAIKFDQESLCDSCARCKHVRSSFKPKRVISTSNPLELVHMDLCGPMKVRSRGGSRYIFVLVDDYSRYV